MDENEEIEKCDHPIFFIYFLLYNYVLETHFFDFLQPTKTLSSTVTTNTRQPVKSARACHTLMCK